jgi:hypothetical protein
MSELDSALDYARHFGLTDRDIASVVKAEADRRRFEPANDLVTLEYGGDVADIRVAPDAVEHWEAGGWRVKPAPVETEPVEPPAEPAKTSRTAKKTEE